MSLLDKLWPSPEDIETTYENDDSEHEKRKSLQNEEKACNISGHSFEQKYGPEYHAHGVPHFGRGDSFTVKKSISEECSKCGKYRQRKEKIGKVRVDADTDEMTVVQQGGRL